MTFDESSKGSSFWETCSQNKVVNTRDLEDRRLYWHLECLARPLPKGEVSFFVYSAMNRRKVNLNSDENHP